MAAQQDSPKNDAETEKNSRAGPPAVGTDPRNLIKAVAKKVQKRFSP
jgi:hypothetical protein